jgi:radical SAM superfamily enzyme YgiQ (UPF0313 family)
VIFLVSTFASGHQPIALARAAAHLEAAGFATRLIDLAVDPLPSLEGAEAVAISVPMHTALRLAARVAARVPDGARLCFFGLYAPLHAPYLEKLGADAILGGESEEDLVAWARGAAGPRVTLRRLPLLPPAREGLPKIDRYAKLIVDGEERLAGQVESTRGCKHRCRHCPIPAVYDGRFYAIDAAQVIADARALVEAGARHLSFGDADFLNGPRHALKVARGLPRGITFDATIKVSHVLEHADAIAELASLGMLFVTSAVESLDDRVLEILDKGHRAPDVLAAEEILRRVGVAFRPTFVPFTPWETREGYRRICAYVAGRTDAVAPVQLSLRLLVPPGSLLLPWFPGAILDEERLTYRWTHPDASMDELQREVERIVHAEPDEAAAFAKIFSVVGIESPGVRKASAHLSEPWFC